MALSRLAAELIEVKPLLRDVADGVGRINAATQQVLDNTSVAPIGGVPSGPTLFGPNGAPIGGPTRLGGAGSIDQFLQQLANRPPDSGIGSGPGSGGGGGRVAPSVRPANAEEQNLMRFLQEDVSYIRKLIAAAKWARLDVNMVIRAPKDQRDALIAAYEEAMGGTRAGSSSGGGLFSYDDSWRDPVIRRSGDSPPLYAGYESAPSGATMGSSTGGASAAAMKTIADGIQQSQTEPTAGDQLVAESINQSTAAIKQLTAAVQISGTTVRAAGGI